jgi:hypothetical protein
MRLLGHENYDKAGMSSESADGSASE